jgi:mevalonate kinase
MFLIYNLISLSDNSIEIDKNSIDEIKQKNNASCLDLYGYENIALSDVNYRQNVVFVIKETKDVLCFEYEVIEKKAVKAIQENKLQLLGQLMDENQELLRKINVSGSELEEIISIAKKAGALGAKLTGTGRGGLVICLTPGKELQEKVSAEIEAKGYKTIKTVVG